MASTQGEGKDSKRKSRAGEPAFVRMRADEKWFNLSAGARDDVPLTYEMMRATIPRVALAQIDAVHSGMRIADLEVVLTPSRFNSMARTAAQLAAAASVCAKDAPTKGPRACPYPISTFHGSYSMETMRIIAERGFLMPGETDPISGKVARMSCGWLYGEGVYTSRSPEVSRWYTSADSVAQFVLLFNIVLTGVVEEAEFYTSSVKMSRPRARNGFFPNGANTRFVGDGSIVVSASSSLVFPVALLTLQSASGFPVSVSVSGRVSRPSQAIVTAWDGRDTPSSLVSSGVAVFRHIFGDFYAVQTSVPNRSSPLPRAYYIVPQELFVRDRMLLRMLSDHVVAQYSRFQSHTLLVVSCQGAFRREEIEHPEGFVAAVLEKVKDAERCDVEIGEAIVPAVLEVLEDIGLRDGAVSSSVLFIFLNRPCDTPQQIAHLAVPEKSICVHLIGFATESGAGRLPAMRRQFDVGRLLKLRLETLSYYGQFCAFVGASETFSMSSRTTEAPPIDESVTLARLLHVATIELEPLLEDHLCGVMSLGVRSEDQFIGEGFVPNLWSLPSFTTRWPRVFRGRPPATLEIVSTGRVLNVVAVDEKGEHAIQITPKISSSRSTKKALEKQKQLQRICDRAAARRAAIAASTSMAHEELAALMEALNRQYDAHVRYESYGTAAIIALCVQFRNYCLHAVEDAASLLGFRGEFAIYVADMMLKSLELKADLDESAASLGNGGDTSAMRARRKRMRGSVYVLRSVLADLRQHIRLAAQGGSQLAKILKFKNARNITARVSNFLDSEGVALGVPQSWQARLEEASAADSPPVSGIGIRVKRSDACAVDPWRISVRYISHDPDDLMFEAVLTADLVGTALSDERGCPVTDLLPDEAQLNVARKQQAMRAVYGFIFTRSPMLFLPEQPYALLVSSWAALAESLLRLCALPSGAPPRDEIMPMCLRLFDVTLRVQRFAAADRAMGAVAKSLARAAAPFPGAPYPFSNLIAVPMSDTALGSDVNRLLSTSPFRLFACMLDASLFAELFIDTGARYREFCSAMLADCVAQLCGTYLAVKNLDGWAAMRDMFGLSSGCTHPCHPMDFSRRDALIYTAGMFRRARGLGNASAFALVALLGVVRELLSPSDGSPGQCWFDTDDRAAVAVRLADAFCSRRISMHTFLHEVYPGEPGGRVEVALVAFGFCFPRRNARAGARFADPAIIVESAVKRAAAQMLFRQSMRDHEEKRHAARLEVLAQNLEGFLASHGGAPRMFTAAEVLNLNQSRMPNDQLELLPSGLLKHHCCFEECASYLGMSFATQHDLQRGTRRGLYQHLKPLLDVSREYVRRAHLDALHHARHCNSFGEFARHFPSRIDVRFGYAEFLAALWEQAQSYLRRSQG